MDAMLRAGLSNAVASTLMAIVVLGLTRPLARWPAVLHGLWVLVLIKLVTPPFYEIPIPWPASPAAAVAAAETEVVPVERVDLEELELEIDPAELVPAVGDAGPRDGRPSGGRWSAILGGVDRASVSGWIAGAWLVGTMAVLVVSLRRVLRFHRLLKEARAATWAEQERVDEWARRLGLRKAPELRWVPGAVSPMIWFAGARPLLVVPSGLWKRLDGRQQSTLVAHELAHVRRGDHFVRLLELAVTALFWWHPLVWWMRIPLRDVEEQCCDAWVVWAIPDAARAYAETLLDTLEFLQPSGRPDPLLASGLGKVPHLRRRLTMIMTGRARRSPGLFGKLGLALAAGVVLPVGASWAEKADEPRDATKETTTVTVTAETVDIAGPVEVVSGGSRVEGVTDAETKTTIDPSVVLLRVEGRPEKLQSIRLSGPLDDVVRKVEARIVELKKQGEKDEGTEEEIQALVKALEALKKVPHPVIGVAVNGDLKPSELKTFNVRYLADIKTDADGDKAAEVARARREIARLTTELKSTVERLGRERARLRELGEDPGAVPVVGWHHEAGSARVSPKAETRAVVIRKPVTVTRTEPHEVKVFVREKARPVRSQEDQLQLLEKKLKEIQQEFERLKKGSDRPAANK